MPHLSQTMILGDSMRYPPGAAAVGNVLFSGPASHYSDLWQSLADEAKVQPNEGDVFEIRSGASVLYVEFSDGTAAFSTFLSCKPW